MNIKVFHIRLTKEHLQSDQEIINSFLDSKFIKKTATELITGQPNFWSILVFYDEIKTEINNKIDVITEVELTVDEKIIFEALKQWRHDKATELSLPSFMICHNSELISVAKLKPQTLGELSEIKGFGGQKIAKFGDDILQILNS